MVFPARKRQEHEESKPEKLSDMPVTRESLTYMWTDYYAMVAKGFKEAVTGVSGPHFEGAASDLLIRTSQESSLYLLWDYVNSENWKSDLQGQNDTINRLLDFLSSMNWENARLCSFVPGQELVIEVETNMEQDDGVSLLCHMTAGAAAAIMDLLYGEGKTPEKKLFSFRCVETECRSKGAPACRFVVHPNPKHQNGQFIKMEFKDR